MEPTPSLPKLSRNAVLRLPGPSIQTLAAAQGCVGEGVLDLPECVSRQSRASGRGAREGVPGQSSGRVQKVLLFAHLEIPQP